MLAIAFVSLTAVPSRPAPPQTDGELRREYEELSEGRYDSTMKAASQDREINGQRFDLLEKKVAKSALTIDTLSELARDLQFFRKWFLWAFGIALGLMGAALAFLWRAGWKYGPGVIAWVRHIHPCLDENRIAITKLHEKMDRSDQAKLEWMSQVAADLKHLRDTSHVHSSFLMGLGMGVAVQKDGAINIDTNEVVHRLEDKTAA